MSKLNDNKKRIIHTGLYSKVAKEIISSVIGSLSDGWGESNPANDKWWRFADCVQASDGEVLIEVSTESWKYDEFRCYSHRYVYNGFHNMSDAEVKQKFAGWIKKTAKMEMKDENAGNQWNRGSEMKLNYLNYHENVTAADAYFVYEKLLGRDNDRKYAESTVLKVVGKKLSEEATKANEEKVKQIEEKLAHRDQLLKQLKEKKEADIKQIEAQYAKDWHDICDQYKKLIDAIKSA